MRNHFSKLHSTHKPYVSFPLAMALSKTLINNSFQISQIVKIAFGFLIVILFRFLGITKTLHPEDRKPKI